MSNPVDKTRLEYEMKRKGISVDILCSHLGISRSAYYRKLKGSSEFNRSEIQGITNILELESPVDIFFAEEVS